MSPAAGATLTPFLMFSGRGEEAVTFYAGLFPDGAVTELEPAGGSPPGAEGSVRRWVLTIAGQRLMAIDSPVQHAFGFTPAISLFVECAAPAEVDRLWAALINGGQALMPVGPYDFAPHFGWLVDRFGVSWQLQYAVAGD